MKHQALLLLLAGALLASCHEKKKPLLYYEVSDLMEDTTEVVEPQTSYNADNVVSVPFEEKGGVKYVDVMINGQFSVKMIFDSGCSKTLISMAEARYLYEKGCFTENDILGTVKSQIADGSIVEDMVIRLRKLVIGGKMVCTDVIASVSANAQAPLLLGNEVLDRTASYSVDNVNKVIVFNLQQ